MKVLITALILVTVVACGKKTEPVAAPVNPQITDAVTQSLPTMEVLDAGVVHSTTQIEVK
jgi:hypothetical protein